MLASRVHPISVPRILAITSGHWRAGDDPARLADWCLELSHDGVEAVQVREKHLADRELFELVRAVVTSVGSRMTVLVNGRADLAVAAAAHGVHLPSRGVPTAAIRRRFPGLLVGRSTHDTEEVTGEAAGAHYVTFGPVFSTPSKARYGPPRGLDALAAAVATAPDLPVLALGGIDEEGLDQVARSGCHGVAGIRGFSDPSSRRALIDAVRSRWLA